MLAEPVLRRHARIPSQDNLVRFLVIAPERTELVRYKLERSPLLRQAMEAGNWHVIKANHLRTWAAHEELAVAELEPFIGLDPLDRAVRRADAAVRRRRRPDRLTRGRGRPRCLRDAGDARPVGPAPAALYPVSTISRRAAPAPRAAQATTRPAFDRRPGAGDRA